VKHFYVQSVFVLHMYKCIFLFLVRKRKNRGGELRTCPCVIHDSSCDGGPAISLLHFRTGFPIISKKRKSLWNAFPTFQPVDLSCLFFFFFPSSVPSQICAGTYEYNKNNNNNNKKKTHSGVLVDFSIFFEALFSQDKAFFSV